MIDIKSPHATSKVNPFIEKLLIDFRLEENPCSKDIMLQTEKDENHFLSCITTIS